MKNGSLWDNTGASWVWPSECGRQINQYVEFSHEFTLDVVPSHADLLISADSNYLLRINGAFIDCGQYHDFPENKTFDILSVGDKLRVGKNILHILLYYQGETSFQYLPGAPGLIYALFGGSKIIASGLDTRWRTSAGYVAGPVPKITIQLGFTFEFDAGKNDLPWQQIKTGDLTPVDRTKPSHLRPIKKVQIKSPVSTCVVAQGVFHRKANENQTVAEMMQTDFLSARTANDIFKTPSRPILPNDSGLSITPQAWNTGGVYLIIDLGREHAGVFDLDVDAAAGTIIDIAYGEHLDDLRVRAAVGGRNFACRYRCREGRQQFTHYFTRFAGRFIELHITPAGSDRFILYYAGLKPAEYPIEQKGSFSSPNSLQNKIYETAVRTLHLCMHEHYEDCPWREQALYANDSRNQAMCGYYCFGEYEFPAASFDLLGQSQNDDGFFDLCAPMKFELTIPSFSLVWVLAIADHYLFSGDLSPVHRAMPKIKKLMDLRIKEIIDGLLPALRGKRYWHFYDWAQGLSGGSPDASTAWTEAENRFDAPMNLFFILALEAAASLARVAGMSADENRYRAQAQTLRNGFHEKFWDVNEKAYRNYLGTNYFHQFSELTQSLAILADACPSEIAADLRLRLTQPNNGLIETTLSQSLYKFQALIRDHVNYGRWVFNKIDRDWSIMLLNGATSFWETMNGGWDFDNAGSLCHGWSAVPIYFYQAHLLGIRPLEPGFKSFIIDPVKSVLRQASGRVPTPFGPIDLSWEIVGDKTLYRLSHPRETTPRFINTSDCDQILINGRKTTV